jgi:hypothetical protein
MWFFGGENRDEREEVYLTDEVIKSGHRLLAIGIFGKSTSSADLDVAQSMGVRIQYSFPR